MLKQALIYLGLSILIVVFAKYAHLFIVYIVMLYTYINVKIAPVFSSNHLGTLLRQVLSLVLLPVLVAAIPALIYRAIKGVQMPYFYEITWLLWLIVVLSKVLLY